jgi:hypothetical protein
LFLLLPAEAMAVRVVASVNGIPITDIDVTERAKIMPPALNNRENAKNAIIDDYLKIEYAKQINIEPTDKEVADAISENKDNPQMRLAARAEISWQIMTMRTIVPSISVDDKEIARELADLELKSGLPFEISFIRLVGIPAESYKNLKKPESCRDAEDMARKLGGEPQKITAMEYDLSEEIRARIVGLELLEWSPLKDRQTILVCAKKKTGEWKNLDEVIKQNAVYKRAMFGADQLLKQLRRKAVLN